MRRLILAGLLSAAFWHQATAHGGVAMEKDVCKLRIGPYLMHFTGYLPDKSRSEFCEDIPFAGRTVIVLDFLDDAVRDRPLSFKIVRDDGTDPQTAPALYQTGFRTYASGSAAFRFALLEPGRYVGVAKLRGDGDYVSTFPFSVGRSRMWHHLLMAGVAILVCAGLLLGWALKRRALAIAAAAA